MRYKPIMTMKNKIITLFSLSILIAALSSCNQYWQTIVVKKGNHSTNDLSKMLYNTDKIEFLFMADSSWYYAQPESPGWNKIRGLSHGHHHNNSSARLGYQCTKDSLLVVGAYCYVNGVSPQNEDDQKVIIDTIQPGKVYHCIIKRENDMYIIKFQDKTWTGPAGEHHNWGYLLNPYIGGVFTLDHDWVVKLKDK